MSVERLDEGIKARAEQADKSIEERARLDREVKRSTAAQLAALRETFASKKLPVLENPPASAIAFSTKFLQEAGYPDVEAQEREEILNGMGAESMQRFDALTLREAPPTNEQMQAA